MLRLYPSSEGGVHTYHSAQTIDRLADVMAIHDLHNLAEPPDGLFTKARAGKKPVGPTPLAQVHSPTTSRAPMIRTGSESWQDAPSSSSQGPFTPSTEVTYATPQSRPSHHPSAQTAMRYPTRSYSHPPQHPHARSMSFGYPVDAPPHPQHHGRSNPRSEYMYMVTTTHPTMLTSTSSTSA